MLRFFTASVMSLPPLSAAKGIHVVCIRGETWPVSLGLFRNPAENVVVRLIGAQYPAIVPAAITADTFPADALNADTKKRLLVIVDDAGSLSAGQFKLVLTALQKGIGPGFNFKVRIQLIVNRNGGFSWAPFYTSPSFTKRDFFSRIMCSTIEEAPSALTLGDELCEFVFRVCEDPFGVDPRDPWVGNRVRAQNAAKPVGDVLRSGAPTTLAAATRAGLDRAICSLAVLLSDGNTDCLVAAHTYISASGDAKTSVLRYPYSLRSSDGPRGYGTVLEVAVHGLPAGLFPGVRLIWEGQIVGDEIYDEETVNDAGIHVAAPGAVNSPSQSPVSLVCHWETAPGVYKTVEVPLFWGAPSLVAVRPVGLCVGSERVNIVSGHVVGQMGPQKGGQRLMLCPEVYSVEQYGAAFAQFSGDLGTVTSAPGKATDRLCINFPPPYGTGDVKRRHLPAMGIKKCKQFGSVWA